MHESCCHVLCCSIFIWLIYKLKIFDTFLEKDDMLYSCYYIWSDKVLWFNHSLTLHSSVFQEEAKDFITLDNLDQQIEEALDNPKNYNFAIDKEGRVVKRTAFQR